MMKNILSEHAYEQQRKAIVQDRNSCVACYTVGWVFLLLVNTYGIRLTPSSTVVYLGFLLAATVVLRYLIRHTVRVAATRLAALREQYFAKMELPYEAPDVAKASTLPVSDAPILIA